MIGTRLRFFSNKVFGVWVDARVIAFNPKKGIVTLDAYFQGHSWHAKRSVKTTFYRPHGHPQQGEAFTLV